MDITWTTTDLTRAQVEDLLGSDCVARVEAQPHAVVICGSRAHGAWQANERESYAAWRSLAVLLGGAS